MFKQAAIAEVGKMRCKAGNVMWPCREGVGDPDLEFLEAKLIPTTDVTCTHASQTLKQSLDLNRELQ